MAAFLGRKVIISASMLFYGFLDLEYPNFDPKHGFLSSVEAEIISFCQIRQPFSFSAFYVHPSIFQGGSPSKVDK